MNGLKLKFFATACRYGLLGPNTLCLDTQLKIVNTMTLDSMKFLFTLTKLYLQSTIQAIIWSQSGNVFWHLSFYSPLFQRDYEQILTKRYLFSSGGWGGEMLTGEPSFTWTETNVAHNILYQLEPPLYMHFRLNATFCEIHKEQPRTNCKHQ